jgi:transcriptional regulator with XRE-family HTH domain
MSIKTSNTLNALEATKDIWENMTFGGLVHSLRMSDEISQIDLARKIGVSKQFLSDVEHNRKDVGLCTGQKIMSDPRVAVSSSRSQLLAQIKPQYSALH